LSTNKFNDKFNLKEINNVRKATKKELKKLEFQKRAIMKIIKNIIRIKEIDEKIEKEVEKWLKALKTVGG